MKKKFSAELAYVLGIILIAMGAVLMVRADFGVSMVVAPAYLLYRWLSPAWSFFTYGMAGYCLQGVLLIFMVLLIRHFQFSYLFSFVTCVIYGFVLDRFMVLGALLPTDFLWQRLIYYTAGVLLCSAGVSAMFHTYIAPEVYELFVKEGSRHFHVDINKFKTGYDCASCLIGLIMSFMIFGMWHFVGVNWGTILCALVNGTIIGKFSEFYEKHWTFYDRFGWRKYFESRF